MHVALVLQILTGAVQPRELGDECVTLHGAAQPVPMEACLFARCCTTRLNTGFCTEGSTHIFRMRGIYNILVERMCLSEKSSAGEKSMYLPMHVSVNVSMYECIHVCVYVC